MKTTSVKSLYRESEKYIDSNIVVAGWVRTIRDSKAFGFIELNDGTFFKNLQVVFEDEKLDNFKQIAKLPVGSAIVVQGKLVETPGAKQPFEIKAENRN